MRKAVQAAARRNQRRRDNTPPPPPAEAPPTAARVLEASPPAPPTVDTSPKRKASPEEAALTAKNYRLAKELSELRVRHREECKNVTRLTMENMNLASRCREALSHVAMLKRELAAHQRRSAEALAMQRQNAERVNAAAAAAAAATLAQQQATLTPATMTPPAAVEASPTSTPQSQVPTSPTAGPGSPTLPLSLHSPVRNTPKIIVETHSPPNPTPPPKLTPRRAMDVAKELEILDETVASHALMAKATTTTTPFNTVRTPEPQEESSQILSSDPIDSDDFEDEEEEEGDFPTTLPGPKSLDDLPGHRPTQLEFDAPLDEDEDPGESTPSRITSPTKSYFPHSASPKIDNYDEEYPSDFSATRKRAAVRPNLGLLSGFAEGDEEGGPPQTIVRKSSLDAFEESFAIDFPDSFSPRESVAEEKKTEIYNPFQSPAKSKPAGGLLEQDIRKDPPGKIRSTHRSMHTKVFTALSRSPRASDEGRSSRPTLSTTQTSHQSQQIHRQNGLTRVLNPPPLDLKQTDSARSRYNDRVSHQRKVVPFDEPRARHVETEAPSSPRQDQQVIPGENEVHTTPVSVKDRVSLFKGGGPRSPERESLRLNSLGSRRPLYDRSYVDEGDIPMISNIGRSKTSPPRQEMVSNTTTTTKMATATATALPQGVSSTAISHVHRARLRPWDDAISKEEGDRRGVRPVSY